MVGSGRNDGPAEAGKPTEPTPNGRSTPQEEISIARAVFARGELSHAVYHLAGALEAEPRNAEARALLDEIIKMAADPLSLAPWSEPDTPYPIVAVRAYIHAQLGELDEAVSLMAEIYQVVPGVPFLPWVEEWLSSADHMQTAAPEPMTRLLASLNRKLPDDIDRSGRDAVEGMLPLLRAYQARHPHADRLASMLAILVRKLGRVDEALALAQAAYAAQPGYFTAVALAGAYGDRGELDAALAAFQDALQHNPDDLPSRCDIGDTLCMMGRIDEGLAAYQEVLEREPNHPWALPSSLYWRHVIDPDGPWRQRLKEYAAANPDNARAGALTRSSRPYMTFLIERMDALIDLLRQVLEDGREIREFKVQLSAIESPSARLAVERYQMEQYGSANVTIDVAEVQYPDPRFPHGEVEYILWHYRGTDPQPAVGPPAPAVAAAVAELAALPYEAEAWSHHARRVARLLGTSSLEDLLGVMVHPPPRAEAYTIWNWIHRVQVAAAFILGHLDGGWEGSLRRRVLFSLARGPMDWTVEAVIIALGQIAYEEPAAAPDIDVLFRELFTALPDVDVPYLQALITCSAYLPGRSAELRRHVERALQEMGE